MEKPRSSEELSPEQQTIADGVRAEVDFFSRIEDSEKFEKFWEKLASIGAELLKKYPDARGYYLFHMLIGSTKTTQECPKFDFPGDDSVVKKLAELHGEYNRG